MDKYIITKKEIEENTPLVQSNYNAIEHLEDRIESIEDKLDVIEEKIIATGKLFMKLTNLIKKAIDKLG